MAQPQSSKQPARRPVKKFSFGSGPTISVWHNTRESNGVQRVVRSVSICAGRYRDPQTGEWKDAGSYQPEQISALRALLQMCEQWLATTPLPSPDQEDAAGEDLPA